MFPFLYIGFTTAVLKSECYECSLMGDLMRDAQAFNVLLVILL